MCIRSLLLNVCIMNPICLWAAYLKLGYQCQVSDLKYRIMKFVVNVSSVLSGGDTSELMKDLDTT